MRRWVTALVIASLGIAPAPCIAQRTIVQQAASVKDSTDLANFENRLAVETSGVWDVDGEYKGSRGVYYKVTGYLAWVAGTSTSLSFRETAVISLHLEPLAGGERYWLGARMYCRTVKDKGVRCVATHGPRELMDINFDLHSLLQRGYASEMELSEPDDKSDATRFSPSGLSMSRGRLKLLPAFD